MTLQANQIIQQRLLMAPNLTVALEILRMSTMELQVFLQQQIEENPLLEFDEPDDEEAVPVESSEREDPTGPSLDEAWSSHWRTAGELALTNQGNTPEPTGNDLRSVSSPSLEESLRMQLGCQRLSQEQRRLGEALIDRLDENGYLEDPLEELLNELQTNREQLEVALKFIRHLDPPGIGAWSLRECLMLQLERQDESGTLAYRILQDHFELFVQHRLSSIARATNAAPEEVEDACKCLKRLNPKPGRVFGGDLSPAVVPDLLIHKREQHDDVELNDDHLPPLRLNRRYHRMLKASDTPMEVKEFLHERFRQASVVFRALEERKTTLLAIGRCLLSLQRDFVEHGPKALKPLTQAQVASLTGYHASTVSRAMAGKTIDTPHGVFRLEQLFAREVPQATRDDRVSDEMIKSEIRHLIAQEDVQHPLSDAVLAMRLAQRHISVARRTVAKYRTALRTLPAHLRKRRF